MVKWMCHKEEWSRRTGPDGAYIFLPKPDDDDDDDDDDLANIVMRVLQSWDI